MRFAFILAERAVWPVVVMCAVLKVSASGFYAWLRRANNFDLRPHAGGVCDGIGQLPNRDGDIRAHVVGPSPLSAG